MSEDRSDGVDDGVRRAEPGPQVVLAAGVHRADDEVGHVAARGEVDARVPRVGNARCVRRDVAGTRPVRGGDVEHRRSSREVLAGAIAFAILSATRAAYLPSDGSAAVNVASCEG